MSLPDGVETSAVEWQIFRIRPSGFAPEDPQPCVPATATSAAVSREETLIIFISNLQVCWEGLSARSGDDPLELPPIGSACGPLHIRFGQNVRLYKPISRPMMSPSRYKSLVLDPCEQEGIVILQLCLISIFEPCC